MIKSWPTALVLVTALVCLAATVLAGPSLGVESETVNGMLATEGGVGFLILALMRGIRHGGPTDGGGAVALVLVAAALASTTGCGASALAIQADAATITGQVVADADERIVRTRGGELNAIVADAQAECPSGCPDRAGYHADRLADAEARWRPVLDCRVPVVEGLRAWIDAISLAAVAATEELGLQHALSAAARVVLLYAGMVTCVGDAVALPELPDIVVAYAGSAAQ